MDESQLNTSLKTICPRVFPDVAPANTARPYITWQQVGGKPVNFMAGASDKKNARIQINVWSDSRKEATTMIRAIENLMVAAPLTAFIESGAVSTLDPETGYKGAMQDFSFWFDA